MRSLLLIAICFFGPIASTSRVSERAVSAILQQEGSVDQVVSADLAHEGNITDALEDARQPSIKDPEDNKATFTDVTNIIWEVDRPGTQDAKTGASHLMLEALQDTLNDDNVRNTDGKVLEKVAYWYFVLTSDTQAYNKIISNKEKAFVYACFFVRWSSEKKKADWTSDYSYNPFIRWNHQAYLEQQVVPEKSVRKVLNQEDDKIYDYDSFRKTVRKRRQLPTPPRA
jgi:hypothetical protein